MCNRYRMSASQADLAKRYGIAVPYPEDESYTPSELFPDKPAWVVRQQDGHRIVDVMAWGVPTQVPGKRIDKETGKPVLLTKSVTNVRNLASPFWRSMLNRPDQRCLVPVTMFSEYGQQRGSDGKLPLVWFDVPSRPIFSFAGIWRTSSAGITFAFLTCEPNSLVQPIHPKAMPVILHDDDEQRWLDGAPAEALAEPYPAQLMTIR